MDTLTATATPRKLASRNFPLIVLNKWAFAVINGETRELFEYRHLRKNPKYQDAWKISFTNEIVCLAQGIKVRFKGTNIMLFIKNEIYPKIYL